MSLEELYKEIILDHYKNPRNVGKLEPAHIHEGGHNPSCGDQIELFVRLDDRGIIKEVKFLGKGCSISQSSASMMTEVLIGKTFEEAQELVEKVRKMLKGEFTPDEEDKDFDELVALKGVEKFPVRIKCALLPWMTLEQGIKEYRKTKDA